jgi:hypothetical protein
MRLLRRNRRLTWLALYALAVPLVLSFGHTHLHAAKHDEAAHVAASDPSGRSHSPSHHDEDEHHCCICWAVSISGRVLVAQPPSIDRPAVRAERLLPVPSDGAHRSSETVKFQARAPPAEIIV